MTEQLTLDFRIELREEDRAFLVIKCTHTEAGECRFGLWKRAPSARTWKWDGDIQQPTIHPSINCQGKCGRHFTMIKGKATR